MRKYKPLLETLTQEEISKLLDERDGILKKSAKSDFINPKDMRRVEEIDSIIFGKIGKPKEGSKRVTSFTRDRR